MRERIGMAGIAEGQTFGSFDPKTQQKAYDAALSFLENPRTLVFSGPNGVGKTHLCSAVANALIEKHGLMPPPVCLITFQQALLDIRTTYQDGYEGVGEQWYLDRWASIPVLILDEVGQRGLEDRPKEFTRKIGYQIVDSRYRRGDRPILMTTNKSPSQLGEWITESAVDRLFEMGEFIAMEGKSWRRNPR